MYRRTILGLALSAALDDLGSAPYNYSLSSATRDLVWRSFEEAVDEGLREVHRGHRAIVTPSDSFHSLSSNSSTVVRIPDTLDPNAVQLARSTKAAAVKETAECLSQTKAASVVGDGNNINRDYDLLSMLPAGVDPSSQFPLYRYVDGAWTILLKDVDVRLKVPANTHVMTSIPNGVAPGRTASASEETQAKTNSREKGAASDATVGASRGTDASHNILCPMRDVVVHCDFLEITASGAAAKAERALAEAKKNEEMMKAITGLDGSIAVANMLRPSSQQSAVTQSAVKKGGIGSKRARSANSETFSKTANSRTSGHNAGVAGGGSRSRTAKREGKM